MDKLEDGPLGFRVCSSFAKHDQRCPGIANELCSSPQNAVVGSWLRRFAGAVRSGSLLEAVGPGPNQICGQVDESGARFAPARYPKGTGDGLRDRRDGRRPSRSLRMRRQQGNSVQLLEGASADEVAFRRTGEEQARKGIGGRVADLTINDVGERTIDGKGESSRAILENERQRTPAMA